MHEAGRFSGLSLRGVLNDQWIAALGGVRRHRSKDENQGNYSGKIKNDASFHEKLPWANLRLPGSRQRAEPLLRSPLIGVSTPDSVGHSKYNLLIGEYHEGTNSPKINQFYVFAKAERWPRPAFGGVCR